MAYHPDQPSVRGDVALLTGGRRGMDEDTLAVSAAVLLDAALAGAVDVTGRRTLGFDRRRVVPGAAAADPLVADVRRRVEVASSDSPDGWFDRIAVFGEDAVASELVDAGVARRLDVPWWKRLVRHRTLEVGEDAAAAARERIRAAASPRDVALGLVLRETELLSDAVGWRDARKIGRRLDDGALPPSARAIVATLRDRRRRAERIGTYYADD